jgi:hypothetical protein
MIMVDEIIRWPHAKPPFRMGSCHLTTDSDDLVELHAFARALGLRREWFQPVSSPHYDLTPARRMRALELGAVFVPAREQARARVKKKNTPPVA